MFRTEDTTTALFQIVRDASVRAARGYDPLDFSYAWNRADAEAQAAAYDGEIRERGEFLPHYPEDD